MSNKTPSPNDDVSRKPSPADRERNDPAIDPEGLRDSGAGGRSSGGGGGANSTGAGAGKTSTPQGNRYSPDDISPTTQQDRTKGKSTDADIDVDGG